MRLRGCEAAWLSLCRAVKPAPLASLLAPEAVGVSVYCIHMTGFNGRAAPGGRTALSDKMNRRSGKRCAKSPSIVARRGKSPEVSPPGLEMSATSTSLHAYIHVYNLLVDPLVTSELPASIATQTPEPSTQEHLIPSRQSSKEIKLPDRIHNITTTTTKMDPTSAIRTAKLLSVATTTLAAGYSFSFSQNAVPLTYDIPASFSTPIFKGVFWKGAYVAVPSGLISGAASLYLAYVLPSQRRLWVTAAVMSMSTAPWTSVVMMPGIKKLLGISEDKAKQTKSDQNLEHRQLLKTWVAQNYFRASLFLTGGLVGFYGILMG